MIGFPAFVVGKLWPKNTNYRSNPLQQGWAINVAQGHFAKAVFNRRLYLLMQCFSTVFGSCPLSYNLRHPSCSFQYIQYYHHYDHHKMHLQQNATNYHNIIALKMHFITFNFKWQLNFKHFQCDG